MHIRNRVREVISHRLDVDPWALKPETKFIDDLGADSLALTELTLAFEEAFEIDVADEDIEKLRCVDDAVNYVSAKLAA